MSLTNLPILNIFDSRIVNNLLTIQLCTSSLNIRTTFMSSRKSLHTTKLKTRTKSRNSLTTKEVYRAMVAIVPNTREPITTRMFTCERG